MSISPALDIARRALLAQETALDVVGQNIANVNTPGYTRQTPDFESDPDLPSASGILIGSGVHIQGVIQVIDPLLAARRLAAETDRGQQTARRDQLQLLSGTSNDLSQPSLAASLDGFFDAADALARNPAGLAERESLLGRAQAVTTEFNRRSGSIASLQRSIDDRIVAVARAANDDLAKIASFNRAIVLSEVVGQRANDLRDQRQLALNDLASKVSVTAVEDERGSITVASTAGPVLVASGDVVHTFAVQPGGTGLDNRPLSDVGLSAAGGGVLSVPGVFAKGELGGLISVRDGELVTASDNLDTVAGALRDAVNTIQTDPTARDLNGNATTLVPFFAGAGAADLSVAITDPRRIAAALSAEPGDNQNALRLADLRTTAPQDVIPTSAPALAVGSTTLSSYLATELARVGEGTAQASDIAAASELLTNQLEAQRAAVSGVNLNEELTNLLKYQRSFQAAAQVLTVTNAMLDELLKVI
jgi:flagellar hook-associated protein 1 FlgK